jgi:hypothetical protein
MCILRGGGVRTNIGGKVGVLPCLPLLPGREGGGQVILISLGISGQGFCGQYRDEYDPAFSGTSKQKLSGNSKGSACGRYKCSVFFTSFKQLMIRSLKLANFILYGHHWLITLEQLDFLTFL